MCIREKNKILFCNQFGFRKNDSIVYALAQSTEMIKVPIDRGKFGCEIFIALRKAFDTLNHEILLLKLEHYGIRDNVLNWFQSYFSNCKQYVSINEKSSEPL